ncbi:MAG: DUF1987 domain-containing protein [Flavobacteriales bacterium]
MNALHIEATRSTPAISFNPDHAWFRVAGNSIPENASDFYTPIITWLKENRDQLPDGCTFEFSLPYFNSSSLKALYTLLMVVKSGIQQGRRFGVTWYVENDDEFMQEAGESYQEMLGMDINIVAGHLDLK